MRTNKQERGASLVEFAIVAPLLFLLLFGVVEFGRAIITYTAVTTAAREAARFATTVGEDPSNPPYADCDAIRDAAFAKTPLLNRAETDITLTYDNGADCDGTVASAEITNDVRIEVEVSTTFRSPIPLISNLVGDLEITSTQRRSIYPGSA